MKNVHKQHESILKEQMKDKDDNKNRKKMNTLELLYNKALMKAAADQDEHVKKTKVWAIFKWAYMIHYNFYSQYLLMMTDL